jgi:hypothetical protein
MEYMNGACYNVGQPSIPAVSWLVSAPSLMYLTVLLHHLENVNVPSYFLKQTGLENIDWIRDSDQRTL